jgi:hypothetical protein
VPGGDPSSFRLLQELPKGGRSQAEGGRLQNADTLKILGKGRILNKIAMTTRAWQIVRYPLKRALSVLINGSRLMFHPKT